MDLLIKFIEISNSNNYKVDIFPVGLVLSLLEHENIKIISDRNDTDFINSEADLKKPILHPLWHIEFMINYIKNYTAIFDLIISLRGYFKKNQPN